MQPILSSKNDTILTIAFVLAIGVFMIFKYYVGSSRRNNLKRNGIKISAQIKKVVLAVKNQSRVIPPYGTSYDYRIISEYSNPDFQTKEVFTCDRLYGTPILDLTRKQFLDVYVDLKNRKNYWVDISQVKLKDIASPGFTQNNATLRPEILKKFTSPYQEGTYESSDGINYEKVS